MDIVTWTFSRMREDQDEPVYIDANDPTRKLSASGVQTLVRQLTCGLNHHGLARGDTVCVVSFNDINYTAVYLGIIGAGGCFTGANPGYTARELTHHLKITEARFILTEVKTLDISIAAAKDCGIPDTNIFVLNFRNETIPTAHRSWNVLLEYGEQDWVEVNDPSTSAAYVSTSGTTGLPKAAIIPHSYLTSQAAIIEKLLPAKKNISYLVSIPPFHLFTIPVQHALPLRSNMTIYTLPRFEETSFVKAVETFKITRTMAVPPILLALSKYPASRLESLRQIFVGGSPLPLGVQQEMYAKLSPQSRITIVYGMTEAGWGAFWRNKKKDITGSIGQVLPGSKMRVADRDGNILTKEGATGEIQIYNPLAMRGYLNNPAATAEAFTHDNWIRTGDIGYTKDKNWYVVDRAKDLIKVRGWQVSPAEIEAALMEHPDILDVGVIGIPAPDGCGESPMAFIVAEKGSSLDEAHIKLFLATRLARYKNVEEVYFVDKIPRNPIGKILRRNAAKEYSNALQQLDLYEQLKGSEPISSVVSASEEEEVVTTKKRKICSTPQSWSWRKIRILSTS
ncbi:acetyl-CoA synthetase-like protein [Stipitochalara longipes BDJ]|nr:acetyl-CoA synthetase-like protein [Stipitochalara longipes BDJ]